jgi:ribosomal protein L16 Arg81 hydroxylase
MIASIVVPMTEDEFLSRYWGREFVHIPGRQDKFADYFPWEVLNRTLEEHRFHPKRLRLIRAAKDIDAKLYLKDERVDSAKLTNELKQGATLIFNGCEEVHPPLRDLCASLEKLFHVYVLTNLYAGWRTDNGFDIHWDDQNTLILQVSGRKRWQVWKPTRLHPFKEDVADVKTKPKDPPVWEGILEQGGMLSIPRGWWHVAYPLDEPCLHLTVTVKCLNGIDMLQWLSNQLKTSVLARMDVPVIDSPATRESWLSALKQDLDAAWTTDLIDRYLNDAESKLAVRPRLHLPGSAAKDQVDVDRDTPLKLGSRRLAVTQAESEILLEAGGIQWKFGVGILPAIEKFNDGEPHTVRELVSLAPESAAQVNHAVMALALQGVVVVAR